MFMTLLNGAAWLFAGIVALVFLSATLIEFVKLKPIATVLLWLLVGIWSVGAYAFMGAIKLRDILIAAHPRKEPAVSGRS